MATVHPWWIGREALSQSTHSDLLCGRMTTNILNETTTNNKLTINKHFHTGTDLRIHKVYSKVYRAFIQSLYSTCMWANKLLYFKEQHILVWNHMVTGKRWSSENWKAHWPNNTQAVKLVIPNYSIVGGLIVLYFSMDGICNTSSTI